MIVAGLGAMSMICRLLPGPPPRKAAAAVGAEVRDMIDDARRSLPTPGKAGGARLALLYGTLRPGGFSGSRRAIRAAQAEMSLKLLNALLKRRDDATLL